MLYNVLNRIELELLTHDYTDQDDSAAHKHCDICHMSIHRL